MSFWKHVNNVLKNSQIILLVLDSRMPEQTLNDELLKKTKDKIIIYVLNKSDLITKEKQIELLSKYRPAILVSPLKRLGTQKLKERIITLAKQNNLSFPVNVGVVGYPNTGKSTLINVLKGVHAASTSPSSGHTKGVQILKVSNKIRLLDTPGVIDKKEKHSFTGALNINKVKDPEYELYNLLKEKPDLLDKYDLKEEDFLEELALKLNFLKKGAEPDTERAARKVLQDYIKGS